MPGMIRLIGITALLAGAALFGQGGYIQVKAAVAQLLLERAWQQSLDSGERTPPWPWADSYPVAQLEIPRIGLQQIVLSGASGRNLAFAPTHLQSSAAPNSGNTTILSAHRDTHFSRLQEVKKNDLILLHSLGQSRQYRVTDIQIADTRHQQLELVAGDQLVLVTCYPFATLATGGPLRYVVSAEPVADQAITPYKTIPFNPLPLTAQRSGNSDWVF